VNFCERLESAEDFDPQATKVQKNSKSNKKSKTYSKEKGDKWCELHESNTHNTSECSTIKKMKDKSNGKSDTHSKNKTWKRKSDDAKKFTKKEMNAITETTNKAVKIALEKCNSKKRKSDSSDDDSDNESTASTASINNVERMLEDVDQELKEFDYGKMNNLSIEDGEITDEIDC
jgi:phenylalanyl-tRNA synthetase alpha subunit